MNRFPDSGFQEIEWWRMYVGNSKRRNSHFMHIPLHFLSRLLWRFCNTNRNVYLSNKHVCVFPHYVRILDDKKKRGFGFTLQLTKLWQQVRGNLKAQYCIIMGTWYQYHHYTRLIAMFIIAHIVTVPNEPDKNKHPVEKRNVALRS